MTASLRLEPVFAQADIDSRPARRSQIQPYPTGEGAVGGELRDREAVLTELGPVVRFVVGEDEEVATFIDGDAADLSFGFGEFDGATAPPVREQVPGGVELLHHAVFSVRDVDVAGRGARRVVDLDELRVCEFTRLGFGPRRAGRQPLVQTSTPGPPTSAPKALMNDPAAEN